MHRIRYSKLTPAQIGNKLSAAVGGPVSASPLSQVFEGTSLRIGERRSRAPDEGAARRSVFVVMPASPSPSA